jgi:hypothetical protein
MNELGGIRRAHYSGCSTATHPLEGYCAIGDAYWQSAPTSGMVSRRSSRANRPSAGTRSGLARRFLSVPLAPRWLYQVVDLTVMFFDHCV